MIRDLKDKKPIVHKEAFVADSAQVLGDVSIGEGSSIWYNAVLRGDIESIKIGKFTNIQDNSTVHNEVDMPAILGDYVVVGHNSIIHGCTIGDNCLIGMGAIVLNGAVIGENCIIGAGALVTQGKIIPPNSLVLGSPGKVIRQVTAEELEDVRNNAIRYYNLWKTMHV